MRALLGFAAGSRRCSRSAWCKWRQRSGPRAPGLTPSRRPGPSAPRCSHLVHLVIYDSGQVFLGRLLLSWYPSQRSVEPTNPESINYGIPTARISLKSFRHEEFAPKTFRLKNWSHLFPPEETVPTKYGQGGFNCI